MQELETHDLATSAEGCELLGLCFRNKNDSKRALKHFRQALQLDSKRKVNQLYIAEVPYQYQKCTACRKIESGGFPTSDNLHPTHADPVSPGTRKHGSEWTD